ncbi:MAG: hypothetical protein IJ774_11680 [Selenomonadaceae bacterium]|nr:hypothetical protein [Selenomonadaceae bacterium]
MANLRAWTAAALAAIIGGGLYVHETAKPPVKPVEDKIEKPAPRQSQGVGIIDLQRIQREHPDGEQLAELQSRELRLRLELNEAMRVVQLPKPPAPEVNQKVFDEAVWQKNAQIVISQLAELEQRKKLLADEYRKKSEPQYRERRDKVRDEFLNENLNIQLKLQNADNLHLTQEQINDLLQQLERVEFERNAAQKKLLDEWLAEIEKYVIDSTAADEARLKSEAERLQREVDEQTRQKQSEVAERNQQLMDQAIRDIEQRQTRRQELLEAVKQVGDERAELEQKIFKSIVHKATMLASVYRLGLVLVRREAFDEERFWLRRPPKNFELKSPEHVGAVIFATNKTRDLTDELIKEMNRH